LNKLKTLAPYFFGLGLLLATNSYPTIASTNALLQALLFTFVVCIPAWRTERMSYVDIGWPWGLVVIGVVTLLLGEGDLVRRGLVGGLYCFMGGRMGIGALKLWSDGKLSRELPRYQYQALRWERSGETNVPIARQVEVLAQGFANASFLAYPAMIIGLNPESSLSVVELVGFAIACGALLFESIADVQKGRFLVASKARGERNRVCNVGLWRYTRHPNYFGEWMVWSGLVLMALPSIRHLFSVEPIWLSAPLTVGLVFVSRLMYVTLVHHTGAKPAEFYSVQKRPDYVDYQKTTNLFFPGPPRAG
jgi:steroid 5-alpha reductase family enzyme